MRNILISLSAFMLFACQVAKQNQAQSLLNTENIATSQGKTNFQESEAKGEINESIIKPSSTKWNTDPVKGLSSNPDLNSKILQRYIDSVLPYSNIYLPRGDYAFSKTLTISKPIQLYGYAMNATALHFNGGVAGIKVGKRANSTIKDVSIISHGGKTNNPANGFESNSIVTVENITVRNFSGNGVYVWAAVSEGCDASMSNFRNVFVYECKGNGFFLQGNDANGMAFYNCNAMDNFGYGFYDHSFLGNNFYACMAHNSAKGNYRADGPVARSTFMGCYSEQNKAKDYLGGVSYWFGGNLGEGGDNYELHDHAKIFAD
jgi:hypothetical protein